jgi:transcriptional regulator with XRE-family HTH domain
MTLKDKLKKITSEQGSDWLKEAEEKLAHAGARRNARKVALRVLQLLRERGMSQTELAEKMGVSRQQVTKIVKGKENFTFETIEKLESALDITLMMIVTPAGHRTDDNISLRKTVPVRGDGESYVWSARSTAYFSRVLFFKLQDTICVHCENVESKNTPFGKDQGTITNEELLNFAFS